MNVTKLSADGKIRVPIEIRCLLGLKLGDKVTFIQNQNGEVVLINSSAHAIHKAQEAFSGAAEVLGVEDDNDVQALIAELRYGKKIDHENTY